MGRVQARGTTAGRGHSGTNLGRGRQAARGSRGGRAASGGRGHARGSGGALALPRQDLCGVCARVGWLYVCREHGWVREWNE